jgi:3-hydroxy-9,10-secoandrosta-1,3,5(10)-triene-9,17-dione monooxygenase
MFMENIKGRYCSASGGYIERVEAILPLLKANKFKTEKLGMVPLDNMQAMQDAGIFDAIKPKQWGGLEVHPVAWFTSLMMVGTACPSSSWVAGILGGHSWYVGFYDQRAQDDVWSKNRHARIAASFAPTGKVEREGDGFRLKGRWKFLSGVDHSEWAIIGGLIPDETGGEMRFFLVPATDWKIDQESWHVVGLQGSGSKDVDIDSFVPDYRSLSVEQFYNGTQPGKLVNTSPNYRIPWFTMWSYELAGTVTGVALGALQAYIDDNRARSSALLGRAMTDTFYVHTRLSEAATTISDLQARIPANWNKIYDIVSRGEEVSNELRIKVRFEASYTVQQTVEAVLKLLEISGGAALHDDKEVQLHLRGLLGMKLHPFSIWENMAAPYSTVIFGLPCEAPLMKNTSACLF